MFIDPDLLQYDVVWAAAGTWTDVFAITPDDLLRASGDVADLAALTFGRQALTTRGSGDRRVPLPIFFTP